MKSLLGVLMFCISHVIIAQDDPMATLRSLKGDWEILSYSKNAEGQWDEGIKSLSRFRTILGGKFMQEEAIYRAKGYKITSVSYYGYDQRAKGYKYTIMDQEWGVMDTYRGALENGKLIMDNLGDVEFTSNDGSQMFFQLIFDFKQSDELNLLIQLSKDAGKTWQDFHKVDYKRLN